MPAVVPAVAPTAAAAGLGFVEVAGVVAAVAAETVQVHPRTLPMLLAAYRRPG